MKFKTFRGATFSARTPAPSILNPKTPNLKPKTVYPEPQTICLFP